MKRLALFVLLLATSVLAFATIYSYTAKDGKIYYTNERPTGLSTAERAQYKTVTAGTVDTMTKTAPLPLSNRDAVKAIQRKDNAPVVTPPPVIVCVPPEVLNTTTNKCEVLPLPVTTSIAPPSIAIECGGNMGTCTLPSGVTAKVWFGAGGSSGKWVSKDNVTGTVGCNAGVFGDPQTGAYNRCLYVDNKLLAKDLDSKGANLMPFVNLDLVPKGSAGFSVPMIKAAPIPPTDSVGAFRISCEYSHMSNDDPIVYPGVPNATHHHTFFGNTGANAYSTSESLHTTGNSTCAGGILNRSGYWMPSLINTKTGAPAKPSVVVVYYKGAGIGAQNITAPPFGLRMIAGNAKPLAVADAQGSFFCQDLNNNVAPHYGFKWQGKGIKDTCGGSNVFMRMIISFPQCWDGKNLDSPDHKSHMAYVCNDECLTADNKIGKTFNGCPATHPVLIPSIAINADFFDLDPTAKYRLASDNYSTAFDGGYSLHADWMNGWDEPTLNRMVKNCLNNPKNCGGPNLGDGQTLYGVNQD